MKHAKLILEEDVIYMPYDLNWKEIDDVCADRTKCVYSLPIPDHINSQNPPECEFKDSGQIHLLMLLNWWFTPAEIRIVLS